MLFININLKNLPFCVFTIDDMLWIVVVVGEDLRHQRYALQFFVVYFFSFFKAYLMVPKRKIFVTELFTLSDPIF
jgi:hypothetical protein